MERIPAYPIERPHLERWSPRAFTAEVLPDPEILRLFEAARWAPSSSNLQPWRLVYAHRETPEFETLMGLLVPFNQGWCARASVLVALFAKTKSDAGEEWRSASFDTGAAWMNLALQAHAQGLFAHAMGGIVVDKMNATLSAPADWQPQCMIAIGRQGPADTLNEKLKARETPSDREPLSAHVFVGNATNPLKAAAEVKP
jgi:nitroreductase